MLRCAVEYIKALADKRVSGGLLLVIHQSARNVWSALNLVCMHEGAMKVVVKSDDLNSTISVLKEALDEAYKAVCMGVDVNSVVEANVDQLVALLSIWSRRLGGRMWIRG